MANKNWYNYLMNKEEPQIDYDRPVAYDVNGRPLYARPDPTAAPLHISRPVEPPKPFISDDIKAKHNASKKLYPNINISDSEYVIASVKRHPIGLVAPFALGTILIALAFLITLNYGFIAKSLSLTGVATSLSILSVPISIFVIIIILSTYISYYVYVNNRMYLTNESVFQNVQTGLFSKREQTVSLGSIEDASYAQVGILQQLFDYGSIRLSTIGDENTYRLSYVAKPKAQIDTLNNAVEAFKNGRPVESKV